MCIISSKICPGSAYVQIFVTKCCILCVWENNVVFYDFCDKNGVFQVSSMVLIQHKYNSKWGRKAKMNWFKLTCAKLTSCNYLQVHYRLKLAYINHWKISFKYHNILWLSQYRYISKWCNILHSRYVAIQNAHP